MKLAKYEIMSFLVLFGAWVQLISGFYAHSFFILGLLIVIFLLAIIDILLKK
jgi:hypothetical protein